MRHPDGHADNAPVGLLCQAHASRNHAAPSLRALPLSLQPHVYGPAGCCDEAPGYIHGLRLAQPPLLGQRRKLNLHLCADGGPVAFNSGPFKMLRGNIAHDAVPKGLLPPLRTRTGVVVSFVGMLRWAFYGGHDRTSVMTSFMINPRLARWSMTKIMRRRRPLRKANSVLPALLGAAGTGTVLLRYGPRNCFKCKLDGHAVEQSNA